MRLAQFTVKVPSATVLYQWERTFKGTWAEVKDYLAANGGADAIRADRFRVYEGNARLGIRELQRRGLV